MYWASFFFFNDTATTEIYTLSLHDALPIYLRFIGRYPHPAIATACGQIGQIQRHAALHCQIAAMHTSLVMRPKRLLSNELKAADRWGQTQLRQLQTLQACALPIKLMQSAMALNPHCIALD